MHNITPEAVWRLWNAVVLSTSIDEFTFVFPGSLKHGFNLTLPINKKKTFEIIHFGSNFTVNDVRVLEFPIDSTQELRLFNKIESDDQISKIFSNVHNVKYLACTDHLFITFLVNKQSFIEPLIELDLFVDNDTTVPASFLVVDQLPCLQVLSLHFRFMKSDMSSPMKEFLMKIINVKTIHVLKLNFCNFRIFRTPFSNLLWSYVLSVITKNICLDCVELIFDHVLSKESLVGNSLKQLLKNNHLKQLTFVNLQESSFVYRALISLFSEKEFHIKHEQCRIWSSVIDHRSVWHGDRIHVSLKNEINVTNE